MIVIVIARCRELSFICFGPEDLIYSFNLICCFNRVTNCDFVIYVKYLCIYRCMCVQVLQQVMNMSEDETRRTGEVHFSENNATTRKSDDELVQIQNNSIDDFINKLNNIGMTNAT